MVNDSPRPDESRLSGRFYEALATTSPSECRTRAQKFPSNGAASMRQFDRVWYGFQVPTAEALAAYRRDQKELLNHV